MNGNVARVSYRVRQCSSLLWTDRITGTSRQRRRASRASDLPLFSSAQLSERGHFPPIVRQ
jgi:hypothetical protein